jgi:hypothetical protein
MELQMAKLSSEELQENVSQYVIAAASLSSKALAITDANT